MSGLLEPGRQLSRSLEGFTQGAQLARQWFSGLSCWNTPQDDQNSQARH